MWNLKIVLLSVVVPCFVHCCFSLCGFLLAMSRLWKCFSDLHQHKDTSTFSLLFFVLLPAVWNSTACFYFFSLRWNMIRNLCPVRLHGCCSWCRFALWRKLKENREGGGSDWAKKNYCHLWQEEDLGVSFSGVTSGRWNVLKKTMMVPCSTNSGYS